MMKMILVLGFNLLALSSWAAAPTQVIKLAVTEKGFEPKTVDVKPGVPVVLEVTRKSDETCATSIQIPSKKITKELPLNKTVTIKVGALEKGEIRFGCQMDMMEGGTIQVK